ncbi:MAG: hypothetical protein PHE51_01120 [Eubacteriales bacterium]|nr:hypothetical protein [Eubacteriales bacterium]
MMVYKIAPTPEVCEFYEQIAKRAHLPVEKVIEDSLLRYAGELSLKHIKDLNKE